jgi:hypothetical protein
MRLAVTAVVESLLIFKLVTFSTIGMCALVGLAALLISVRKDFRGADQMRRRLGFCRCRPVRGAGSAIRLYAAEADLGSFSFERVHFQERVPRALSGSSLASS